MEEDETNIKENTGFDVNRKVMKITGDDTAVKEKIDENVNQNLVKKRWWHNNNEGEDNTDVEDKILDDFNEQFGKNYERADATNVEKNLDDNVIHEPMKRNGDDTDMKEKPDEYVKINRREDNINVKEKTRDDVNRDPMQQNDMYMNNKKDEDTDVKEKDDKSSQELVKKNGWYRNNKRKETDPVKQELMKRNDWYRNNKREDDNNVEDRTDNVKKNG